MRTIGDLANADPALLEARLGEHGATIAERAKGIDADRDVVADPGDPKSIGHAHTFDRNTLDRAQIESTLLRLAEGVGRRCANMSSGAARWSSSYASLRSRLARGNAPLPSRPPTTSRSSRPPAGCFATRSPRTATPGGSARSGSWA